jgi:protein TonB
MFENTLEAQSLNDGQRRIGALSAAALAHLGIGLAIVAVTALIVPPVHPPEAPHDPFAVISLPPLEAFKERLAEPQRPKKGNEAVRPGKSVVRPPVVQELPPTTTPDHPPEPPEDTIPEGIGSPGDGTPGDPNGSPDGVLGSVGDGDGGGGADHGVDPLELTGDMVRPVLLVRVEPSYPQVARRAGLHGRVTLRAVIAEDGAVESVEVLASTNPLFSDAAVDAVRKWRYRPASMGGRPVRVFFSVVVDFIVR